MLVCMGLGRARGLRPSASCVCDLDLVRGGLVGCDVRGRSESVSEPPGEGTCRPSDVYVSNDGSDSYR